MRKFQPFSLNLKGELVEITRPQVMGILNVTPDSFYSDSRSFDAKAIGLRIDEMIAEKQTNNTKNQRRANYCISIQKAIQYKGSDDHEDVPSILVAFEKEIKNELLPKNAIILTREELHEIEENAYQVGITLGKQIGSKETATNILKGLSSTKIKICNDYYIFAENIDVLAKHYEVKVKE